MLFSLQMYSRNSRVWLEREAVSKEFAEKYHITPAQMAELARAARDGKPDPSDQDATSRIIVVQNWFEESKRRVTP